MREKKIYILIFYKKCENQEGSVIFGSFAFKNQNFAQTKENLAGTFVYVSPAFRNSGGQGFTILPWPLNCANTENYTYALINNMYFF